MYNKALEILHDQFKQGSIIESKTKSASELFTLLQTDPSSENDIRTAILHFYDRFGLACYTHKDKSTLHIITRIKNRTNNIYIQRLNEFLRTQPQLSSLSQEPNTQEVKSIFEFVENTFDLNEELTRRELIKTALKQTFGVQARDALFFKNGAMKFYKFDYEMVKINNEIRQVRANTHLNVLNNEDKRILNMTLRSINIHSLIIEYTLEILEQNIHLASIDNLTFNQTFSFFAMQKIRLYLEAIAPKQIDSLAKSIYTMDLVQKYANVMFELVAKELLELCAGGNTHALEFIEFYNGGTIKLKSKTFQKPLMTDQNGNPWTTSRIKECLQNKKSVDFDISQMQKKIDELNERIQSINELIQKGISDQEALTHKEAYYQQLYNAKNKALRESVDSHQSKASIKALSDETNALILDKGQILKDTESIHTHLLSLSNEKIVILQQQNHLKGQIAYTMKKNKNYFLQYDLLTHSLAECIMSAKDILP